MPEEYQIDWFDTLADDVKAQLAEEFNTYQRLQAILDRGDAPSVKDTIEMLARASQLSSELVELLEALSPIAQAGVFEASIKYRRAVDDNIIDVGQRLVHKWHPEFGRSEIANLRYMLDLAAPYFSYACLEIANLHSPSSVAGQGTGSAMGRDADIMVLKADHGRTSIRLLYNQPKDLFGCSALAILYEVEALAHPDTRGSAKQTLERLKIVWERFSDLALPNWNRVVRDRGVIYERAKIEREVRGKSPPETTFFGT